MCRNVPRFRRPIQTLLGISCLEHFISGCTAAHRHGVWRGLVSQVGFFSHIEKLSCYSIGDVLASVVGLSSSLWKDLETQLRKYTDPRPNCLGPLYRVQVSWRHLKFEWIVCIVICIELSWENFLIRRLEGKHWVEEHLLEGSKLFWLW